MSPFTVSGCVYEVDGTAGAFRAEVEGDFEDISRKCGRRVEGVAAGTVATGWVGNGNDAELSPYLT